MSASFIGNELNDNEILKSSDVAESIIYALGVPKRVNVCHFFFFYVIVVEYVKHTCTLVLRDILLIK